MGVDHDTKPRFLNIVIEKNPAYLEILSKQATNDEQNEDGKEHLSLTLDKQSFRTEEYYYDADSNTIEFNGILKCSDGSTWVGISIPISDTVLIDILNSGVKKLNKLKTVLESLK